jgi:hypothetical protein
MLKNHNGYLLCASLLLAQVLNLNTLQAVKVSTQTQMFQYFTALLVPLFAPRWIRAAHERVFAD